MNSLERIKGISPEDFRREFVAKRKPVILEDATKKWIALEKWTPKFWQQNYGDKVVEIDGNKFSLNKVIELALNSDENNPAPYYRNIRISHEYPELIQDISPESDYCLPNYFLHKVFTPLRTSLFAYGQYELFIGGKGRSFPYLHYDVPGADTFIHQIAGEKELVLFSPEDSRYLYPKSGAEFNVSSIPDIENVSLDKFPLYKNAQKITVTLKAGESIYFPSGWWHTAKMLSFSISIGIDVANQFNWETVEGFLNKKAKAKLSFLSPAFMFYLKAGRSLVK
ncbi:Transcription factor jumonji [Ignavibacterium album JCM 16511]|uniref:Transcription factor jumonji n=1 Tax=Ignavibacterium album (strain DSM 19864 / JCM 16511 / NBRC 101810 / Mat9-16) TaxID=945713 RepID=I0AMI2_IGNAJ|nr:cupin-like domain-containing protein [Ignavibacterium album]AFH50189.1 Transcription factor jumonji [Ignavibacterium album JCM 16511]